MTEKKMSLMRLMVWAGEQRVRELLPAPLTCWAQDHSTGCQASIHARQDGLPSVEVWRDSEWYSSIYDFNERGRERGIQQGCEWAKPAIDKLCSDLSAAHTKASTDWAAHKAEEEARNRKTTTEAHATYAAMLS